MTFSDFLQGASDVRILVAAIFAATAAWAQVKQFKLLKQQGVITLEDTLVSEYHQRVSTLPLLGEVLTDHQHAKSIGELYRYFDLCNHQVFLHDAGRVGDAIWKFWKECIESVVRRVAFARAWVEIAVRGKGNFEGLRRLGSLGPYTTAQEAS